MDNFDDFVDVLEFDASIGNVFSKNERQYKVRMIVGYKIAKSDFYLYKKYGAMATITKEMMAENQNAIDQSIRRLKDAAIKTWDDIESQKEWTYEKPLYAYHFGADYEVDNDFNIVGDWPEIGRMIVQCDKVFLMKNGELPDEHKHLRIVEFPEPTGKRTLKQS